MYENIISERLNELMFDADIDSKQLAKDIGVSKSSVHHWRQNATEMYLSSLIAVCEYFNCSLEFLVGRSEVKLDFIPHPCEPFYGRVRSIMKDNKITRYHMVKNSKFKEGYFQNWKNGRDPRITTLIELADYLKVTLDFLVGRER